MNTPYRMLALILVFSAGLFLASPGWAQEPRSDESKNLQYFPQGTKRSELIPQMRQFSFALGVACTHCHGTEEQTGFDLRGVDFALDIKPTKQKAREMLRMVEEINSNLLAKIPSSELNLEVSCFTCHSGIPLPEMIEARVLRKIEGEGLETAIADYRLLRERYMGSAAYNFKEQPLVEAAAQLHEKGKFPEAAAISELNLEFHPESGQSKFRLAEAFLESNQKEKALKLYRELIQANPNDRRVKQRLEALENQ